MAELAGLESVFSLGHRARTAVFLLRLRPSRGTRSIWPSNEIQLVQGGKAVLYRLRSETELAELVPNPLRRT